MSERYNRVNSVRQHTLVIGQKVSFVTTFYGIFINSYVYFCVYYLCIRNVEYTMDYIKT